MGVIKGHFDKICTDAIKRYTKKKKISAPDELQVLLYLDAQETEPVPAYMILKNFSGLEKITAKQLLDTKLDFMNRAAFLQVRTAELLHELVEEHEMQWQQIRVIIQLKQNDVVANLYRDNEFIKVLDMETLLSDEKMMQANG